MKVKCRKCGVTHRKKTNCPYYGKKRNPRRSKPPKGASDLYKYTPEQKKIINKMKKHLEDAVKESNKLKFYLSEFDYYVKDAYHKHSWLK
jgi:hypothetical protein